MKNEWIIRELNALTYRDDTDIVALRFLLLHALAQYAAEYKKASGPREVFQLLQQYRKLEGVHMSIKEKCRNNCAGETDFKQAKAIALHNVAMLSSFKTMVTAA